ncbi:MAG: putative transporter (DMT superfamily), partial [Microgenomates group bacterium GW2011_GWA2_44_7]
PPLPLTFWAFLIGTITFIPLALTETASFPILDYRGWIGIVYGAVFSSAIAYAFHTWGLSKISASEVSLFAYIDPVVAMFIAYPLLGEKPTPLFIVGAILVFGGIYIAERRLNYHPLNKILQKTKSK